MVVIESVLFLQGRQEKGNTLQRMDSRLNTAGMTAKDVWMREIAYSYKADGMSSQLQLLDIIVGRILKSYFPNPSF